MNPDYETLQKETDVASKWWTDILQDIPEPKVLRFKDELKKILVEKFREHWDVENSLKGSGFRAISADSYRIDPALTDACRAAEIDLKDFSRSVFRRGIDHVMFINPGEVKIRNCALLTTSSTIVWSLYPPKATPPPTPPSHTPSSQVHSGHHSKIATPTHSQLQLNASAYVPHMHPSMHPSMHPPPHAGHPPPHGGHVPHPSHLSNHRPSANAPPWMPSYDPPHHEFDNRIRSPRK